MHRHSGIFPFVVSNLLQNSTLLLWIARRCWYETWQPTEVTWQLFMHASIICNRVYFWHGSPQSAQNISRQKTLTQEWNKCHISCSNITGLKISVLDENVWQSCQLINIFKNESWQYRDNSTAILYATFWKPERKLKKDFELQRLLLINYRSC